MLGTLFNSVAVAIGASLGLVLRRRVPEKLRTAVFSAIGLFTLYIGADMMGSLTRPIAAFIALVLGAGLGHVVGLDQKIRKAAGRLGQGEGAAMVQSTLLFCVGAMTLVGCMQDGLRGDPSILLAKGTMDLFSSLFLAATMGRGVLLSALSVLVLQGTLTLLFSMMGTGIPESLIHELTGLGGILLLALGLDLLNIRTFSLIDLTWSLPLLPFVLWILDVTGFPA